MTCGSVQSSGVSGNEREHIRGIRPRWPAVTRTTVHRSSSLLPALVSDVGAELPRLRSERHLALVTALATRDDWAGRALHACLTQLLTSTVTEAGRVWVVDAWTETSDGGSVCVLYRPPHDEGRVVGLRRSRQAVLDHLADPSDWRIGDLTTWGYDMGAGVRAEEFGWNVADFDVGEPLGYVTTVLRYGADGADIGWWGNLGEILPVAPNTGPTVG